MEDGIGREDTFSLSLENEILLGRKPLEKQLTHSSACDNPTVVMLLGSQRAWTSCHTSPILKDPLAHPGRHLCFCHLFQILVLDFLWKLKEKAFGLHLWVNLF